jgi:hypothetical protein
MIGFIRRSDIPAAVIGWIISVPLIILTGFGFIHFFPNMSSNVFAIIAFCIVALSYASGIYITKWMRKRV